MGTKTALPPEAPQDPLIGSRQSNQQNAVLASWWLLSDWQGAPTTRQASKTEARTRRLARSSPRPASFTPNHHGVATRWRIARLRLCQRCRRSAESSSSVQQALESPVRFAHSPSGVTPCCGQESTPASRHSGRIDARRASTCPRTGVLHRCMARQRVDDLPLAQCSWAQGPTDSAAERTFVLASGSAPCSSSSKTISQSRRRRSHATISGVMSACATKLACKGAHRSSRACAAASARSIERHCEMHPTRHGSAGVEA